MTEAIKKPNQNNEYCGPTCRNEFEIHWHHVLNFSFHGSLFFFFKDNFFSSHAFSIKGPIENGEGGSRNLFKHSQVKARYTLDNLPVHSRTDI